VLGPTVKVGPARQQQGGMEWGNGSKTSNKEIEEEEVG
jgi:hypothetical protein